MGQRARGGAVVVVKTLIVSMSFLVSLAGCAAEQAPILTPIEVKVPVATPIYCQVGKLDKPALPIAALQANSTPPDTVRAYAATVAILEGAVRERDLVIAGCAAPASDQGSGPQPATTVSSGAGVSSK
jgi:hypothetical protein